MQEAPPPSRPAPVYSIELAEAICARIAQGESIRAICKDRSAPCHDTLHRWARRHPEFARMKAEARLAARTAQVRRREGRRLTAKAGRKHAWGREDLYRPELGAEICRRLAEGRSLLEACADPAMPRPSSVYRWLARHADFAELYAQAREAQAHGLFDLAWQIARDATPQGVPLARLQFEVIRWRTAKLAPKAYGAPLDPEASRPTAVYVRRFGRGPEEEHEVFAGYF